MIPFDGHLMRCLPRASRQRTQIHNRFDINNLKLTSLFDGCLMEPPRTLTGPVGDHGRQCRNASAMNELLLIGRGRRESSLSKANIKDMG